MVVVSDPSAPEAGDASPGAPAAAALEPQPIGAYLKQQRQLRGIRVEDLAALTRIPLRSLERLEAGLFDGETDGFVRGFVRTVAGALGLEPDDTVSRMLSEPRSEDAGVPDMPLRLPRAFVGLAAVLLLAAAIGLIRAVSLTAGQASSRPHSEDLIHRRDPVAALAESQAAIEPPPLDSSELALPRPRPAAGTVLDSARAQTRQ